MTTAEWMLLLSGVAVLGFVVGALMEKRMTHRAAVIAKRKAADAAQLVRLQEADILFAEDLHFASNVAGRLRNSCPRHGSFYTKHAVRFCPKCDEETADAFLRSITPEDAG